MADNVNIRGTEYIDVSGKDGLERVLGDELQDAYDAKEYESISSASKLGVVSAGINIVDAIADIQDKMIPEEVQDIVNVKTDNSKFWKDIQEEEKINYEVYGNDFDGDSFTAMLMRHAPEFMIASRIPMSAYSTPIKIGKYSVPQGLAVGPLESTGLSQLGDGLYTDRINKEGEVTEWWEQALFDSGVGLVLGGGLGYSAFGKSNYTKASYTRAKEASSDELVIPNKVANISSANRKIGMSGTAIAALALANEQNAEANMLSDAIGSIAGAAISTGKKFEDIVKVDKPKVVSTDDINSFIGIKKGEPSSEIGYQVEDEFMTTMSSNQITSTENLISQVIKSGAAEYDDIAKSNTELLKSINDIIDNSNLGVKVEAGNVEAQTHKMVNEYFPIDTPENIASRNALGIAYRGGLDDIDIRQLAISPDAIEKEIASRLYKDPNISKLNDIANNIANHIADNQKKIVYSKNVPTALNKAGIEATENRIIALEQMIKQKYLDNMPDENQILFKELVESRTNDVADIFGTRSMINARTNELVLKGDLKQDDVVFGYVSPKYADDYRMANLSSDELHQVLDLDTLHRQVNKLNPLAKDEGYVKGKVNSYKTKSGELRHEVMVKNSDDFVQGSLPVQSKEMAGATVRIQGRLQYPVMAKDIIDRSKSIRLKSNQGDMLVGVPNKVLFKIKDSSGKMVVKPRIMSFKDYKDNISRVMKLDNTLIDESNIFDLKRPLTNKEKKLLGMSDDIADVAGNTQKSIARNLAIEDMYRSIKSNNRTVITNDNIDSIIDKPLNEKTLFLGLNDLSLLADNPRLSQFIANNYIKIDDIDAMRKTGSRYVAKKYAHQMFGFNKMFMTDGKYGINRAIENMMITMNEWFRTSVVIKNAVGLMNNSIGMMFTNFMYMYVKYGNVKGQAFTGFVSGANSYREFIKLRYELHKAKARNDFTSIKLLEDTLEGNHAYQLYKEGGLQSMLDDGLLSKTFDKSETSNQAWSNSKKALNNILMTENSALGRGMRQAADYSDISNRINLYMMLKALGKTNKEAARETTKVSVNYTKLLSPSMRYSRDIGAMSFITWYSRMIPVIIETARDNPLRAAMIQGAYIAMQSSFGSENYYGDDYMFGVRVESYIPTLALTDPTDVFSGTIKTALSGDMPAIIPQTLQQIAEGRVDKLTGFTQR